MKGLDDKVGNKDGALAFVIPSIKMTTMSKTEENIPTTEVMESHDSGKNTVGKNLEEGG